MNSLTTLSTTFLPGLEDGVKPSSSPAGPLVSESSLAPAPASPSAKAVKVREKRIRGTSGPTSATSSPTSKLQRSLGSKLRALLVANGSPEYVLTWKTWAMLSGPPICALRASVPRILVKDFSGWPTPTATDGRRGKDVNRSKRTKSGENLSHTAHIMSGAAFPERAPTDDPGALNPALSLWLMGFPDEWLLSGVRAMQSVRRSRRSSSKRPASSDFFANESNTKL